MFLFDAGLSIFGIRLYAICILIGILIAVYAAIKEGKKLGIFSDDIYLGVVIIVPISIIGARLWYILFNLDDGWDFGKIIGLDGGLAGLAIQGGVIAAIISTIIYCKKKKLSLYSVFDIVAPGFLIGQVCGRWGNFFNSEAFGTPTNLPWKLYIAPQYRPIPYTDNEYFHPAFLYESILDLIIFFLLFTLIKTNRYKKEGNLTLIYLILYSAARIAVESIRIDSVKYLFGQPVAIIMSIGIIIVALSVLIYRNLPCKTKT